MYLAKAVSNNAFKHVFTPFPVAPIFRLNGERDAFSVRLTFGCSSNPNNYSSLCQTCFSGFFNNCKMPFMLDVLDDLLLEDCAFKAINASSCSNTLLLNC